LALPVGQLRLGEIDTRLLPPTAQSRQLAEAIATHFPQLNHPSTLLVLADAPADNPGLASLRDRIDALNPITDVETAPMGSVTLIRAVIEESSHSDAARDALAAVRAMPAPFEVLVGGDAALLVDYEEMLGERLPYAVLVIGLGTLLLLFWFTRSV